MSAIIDFLSYLIASLISAALIHFGAIAISDTQTNDPAPETALVTSEQADHRQANSANICLDKNGSNPTKDPNCSDNSGQLN
jgi:hypothetical protein